MVKTFEVTFLLLLLTILSGCKHKCLPRKYKIEAFQSNNDFLEDPIELGIDDESRLIYVPVSGAMAFSSANNHIGLYQNNKNENYGQFCYTELS
ncbi:hypothetical protein K8T06_02610 [bacterium]|nr:hypothetical protein [bacterium]